MDEVREFCRRVLGPGPLAAEVAAAVRSQQIAGRVELLAAAASACRSRAETDRPAAAEGPAPAGLAEAVARELSLATSALPERQREALALRELLRLSHDQIATVMGLDRIAVAPLLARARLRLRSERRGLPAEGQTTCAEHDRGLRVLTCRQDSEPLTIEDDGWLPEHLGACEECNRAHAAMLEASVCYRAWPTEPRRAGGSDGRSAGSGAAG